MFNYKVVNFFSYLVVSSTQLNKGDLEVFTKPPEFTYTITGPDDSGESIGEIIKKVNHYNWMLRRQNSSARRRRRGGGYRVEESLKYSRATFNCTER